MAVDPGTAKHGVAVVASDGGTEFQAVVSDLELDATVADLMVREPKALLIGNGTASKPVAERLRRIAGDCRVVLVDERDTTLEARRRAVSAEKPGCLGRLIPMGMRTPSGPVDGIVAVILAERWWIQQNRIEETEL